MFENIQNLFKQLNYYIVTAIENLEKMPDSNEKENVQKCLLAVIRLLGLTSERK